MFGIRQKLLFGFGSLVAILLVVGAMSIVALTRYSSALDRFLSENYRSVDYGQQIKDAIDPLNTAADDAVAGELAAAQQRTRVGVARLEEYLAKERSNITLPHEGEKVAAIESAWQRYRQDHDRILDPNATESQRRGIYRDALQTDAGEVKRLAQSIIEMNLKNMVSVDGQVKQTAIAARRGLYLMVAAGLLLAALFVLIFSRAILQPLGVLTQSAREIEQGNLDLVVPVRSKDELGQLAEAFNRMAARLREFRRSDRARLVRTQRTTQLAVNSLPDAIAIVGPDGAVELANETAQRMFQLRAEQPLAASRINGLSDLVRHASNDGRPSQARGYESAIQVFDERGQERFFLPQAVPIVDGDRQLLGVTLVLADVTNLRKLDEMKSGMLAVVSHELKTPLTSIRMAMHLLLEERVGALTPKQTELLIAARDDSDRLNQIIENLMDMGRLESGRAMMDLQPVRPDELLNGAAAPFATAFKDRGVELKIEAPSDLPDVLADQSRIGHVFSNLLSNALKFTPPGGSVRLSAEALHDAVRFSIADTGSGIPKEFLPRVFERFFRVPGQSASGNGGAGLGLAIAQEIVVAHGGQISADSAEGAGSTFRFTLRRADVVPSAGSNGRVSEVSEVSHGSA